MQLVKHQRDHWSLPDRNRLDLRRPPEELTTDAIAELEGAVEELNAVLALLENGAQEVGG